jgi:glycosyltransferase involved in cell wall biosynthesis
MEISVIFPAYNEERNIRGAMSGALEALRPLFGGFEILVIDDGSRDATGKIADALAAEHPEIRVIHNPVNLGAGACVLIGFRQARCELVIHNAMDYPFDLRELAWMVPLMEDADIVVAARKSRAGYSLYRKLTSVVNVALLRLLFDLRLRDYNFTQLYRKSVLDSLEIEARSTAFLTPETLIRAHDKGYRIKEVEVEYHPRQAGVATSGSPRVIIRSLRDMLRFWYKRARERQ